MRSFCRFLLLPAYLAKLTLRLNDHRYDRLETAEVYIRNFLGLCKDYEVPGHAAIPKYALKPNDAEVENNNSTRLQKTPQDLLNEASSKRAAKIAALKQRMDHQDKVRELQRRIDQGSADDDVQVSLRSAVANRSVTNRGFLFTQSVTEEVKTLACKEPSVDSSYRFPFPL